MLAEQAGLLRAIGRDVLNGDFVVGRSIPPRARFCSRRARADPREPLSRRTPARARAVTTTSRGTLAEHVGLLRAIGRDVLNGDFAVGRSVRHRAFLQQARES